MPERIVQALLASVEALDPGMCGAFVVAIAGLRVGSVFVENNRVCWAATAGLSRRLRQLLGGLGPPTPDDAERTAAVQASMREAFRQHTIESLIALPEQQGEEIEWVTRDHSYSPRFTFCPVELFVGVNARLYANEAIDADRALALLGLEVAGASFVIADAGAPVPVQLAAQHGSISGLAELGAWAEAALGATRGFSHQAIRGLVARESGDIALAWRTSRSLIHAAVFEDREALERSIASLERLGYPAVLSRRISRSSIQAVRDGLGAADHDARLTD